MSRPTHDVIVVGAGLAGLTAAQHARLRGAEVLSLEGELHGGLVVNVGRLDGYPAAAAVSGVELTARLVEENAELGVDMRLEPATGLALEGALKVVTTASGQYRAPRLILATGASLRQLGVPGEAELLGRGVSQCAYCDAGFFRGEDVVVVGGGDAALQEALHLAEHCRSVTLVHRRNRLKARRHYVARAADHAAFRFRWESTVEGIVGEAGVTAVRLRNLASGATDELPCTGVFVFVGLQPNVALLPAEVALDATGAVQVDATLQSSVPGLYAVGAVRAGYGGRLTQAVADGTTAAEAACQG